MNFRYCDQHDLDTYFSDLSTKLLQGRPENPRGYMLAHLAKLDHIFSPHRYVTKEQLAEAGLRRIDR